MAFYHPDRICHLYQRAEFKQAADMADEHMAAHPDDGFQEMNVFLRDEVFEELRQAGVEEGELETIDINADWFDRHEIDFTDCGRQIYDISNRPDAIAIPFDVNDLVGDFNFTDACFYVHWGPEAGLSSPHPGVTVEGFYVNLVRPAKRPAFYSLQLACWFEDPRGREALPLAQVYRRYARGHLFTLDFGETFASSWYATGEAGLWRDHLNPGIRAAISALHFLSSERFKETSFGLTDDDDEIFEMLSEFGTNQEVTDACVGLMVERGVSFVHRCSDA